MRPTNPNNKPLRKAKGGFIQKAATVSGPLATYAAPAAQLLQALIAARKCSPAQNLPAWAKEIESLRKYVDAQRLQTALDWYCGHIGDWGVPEAFSASGFRKRFREIESHMMRCSGDMVNSIAPDAAAIKAAMYIQSWGWPAKADADLPTAVMCTRNNIAEFQIQLLRWLRDPKNKENNLRRFAAHVGYVVPTQESWWRPLWEQQQHWPNWGGDVLSRVFAIGNKPTHLWGTQTAYDYCHDGGRWGQMLAALGLQDYQGL